MWPKEYMPTWEKDFWSTLMEEQGVPYKTHTPDDYVSPYNTGDVLVGEIVEDTPLEIGA